MTTATEPGEDLQDGSERRIDGVALATVVDNVDLTGQARVQLSIAWMPDVAPWARVATLMAGPDTGTYFVPQPGDEVLVAFQHGDPADPYVVGALWNAQDTPPATSARDAQNRFRIRTPLGHNLEFDDQGQTVTLTTTTGHTVTVGPTEIRLATDKDTATVSLGADGAVAVKATGALTLEARSIELKAPSIAVKGGKDVAITAGTQCSVKSAMVEIN